MQNKKILVGFQAQKEDSLAVLDAERGRRRSISWVLGARKRCQEALELDSGRRRNSLRVQKVRRRKKEVS